MHASSRFPTCVMNDDFCDCGTDEPLTAACSMFSSIRGNKEEDLEGLGLGLGLGLGQVFTCRAEIEGQRRLIPLR